MMVRWTLGSQRWWRTWQSGRGRGRGRAGRRRPGYGDHDDHDYDGGDDHDHDYERESRENAAFLDCFLIFDWSLLEVAYRLIVMFALQISGAGWGGQRWEAKDHHAGFCPPSIPHRWLSSCHLGSRRSSCSFCPSLFFLKWRFVSRVVIKILATFLDFACGGPDHLGGTTYRGEILKFITLKGALSYPISLVMRSSELLMTIEMGLDRAPFKILIFVFLVFPSADSQYHQKYYITTYQISAVQSDIKRTLEERETKMREMTVMKLWLMMMLMMTVIKHCYQDILYFILHVGMFCTCRFTNLKKLTQSWSPLRKVEFRFSPLSTSSSIIINNQLSIVSDQSSSSSSHLEK